MRSLVANASNERSRTGSQTAKKAFKPSNFKLVLES